MTPECLNPPYRRKSQPTAIPPFWIIAPLWPLSGNRPAQPHDIADHFGHRLVVLDRDRLVDLDGGMQRAGERRVLDHGNRMFGGDGHGLEEIYVGLLQINAAPLRAAEL